MDLLPTDSIGGPTWVGAAGKYATVAVGENCAHSASEPSSLRPLYDLVSKPGEGIATTGQKWSLDAKETGLILVRFKRRREAVGGKSWSLNGRLGIHAKGKDVQEHLKH